MKKEIIILKEEQINNQEQAKLNLDNLIKLKDNYDLLLKKVNFFKNYVY